MVGSARRARLAVAAGLAGALAACSGGATPVIHRGDVLTVQAGALGSEDVALAQTGFGVDLLHAVCAEAAGQNVLLSPTSAAEALSLLHPAASGETAAAFQRLLHLPAWSPDAVAAFREHTGSIEDLRYDGDLDDDAPDSVQMSNRLWTAAGLQPDAGYLDDLATAFDADVRALDFAGDPEGATDRINTTVAEDTDGIIEELFDQPLRPDTAAVLTNALHLKATWLTPFLVTDSAPFDAPSGEVTVDMMAGATGAGLAVDGWQAVELPYLDGTLSALAVLPPVGTDPCAVEAATLTGLQAAEREQVAVRLPRMRIEQTHKLLDTLTSMGLPETGTYPGLSDQELTISQVVQKTFLEVDEEGTEAAAATGGSAAGAAPPSTVVTFDRPFLFVLTDTATHSPLFVAAVQNPSS